MITTKLAILESESQIPGQTSFIVSKCVSL
jgi:hypothetical protein